MASIQKLIRNSQPTRIFSSLYQKPATNGILPLIFQQPRRIETTPEPNLAPNQSSFFDPKKAHKLFSFSQIYPSFPFGFGLNPVLSSGLGSSEAEDPLVDDSRKVWADSVKKKRKKKMNKHKYQKLRKRLRRQT